MKITTPDMLAQAVKNARKTRRLSQDSTAKLVGIKQDTVSKFETQPESSRIETLFKILAALELELQVTERQQSDPGSGWTEEW